MINGQKVIGVITARGGSKGVPGKNVRIVRGKPLIAWTIFAGKASNYLDRLILSSDDEDIIEVARSLGCDVPFKRTSQLAQDDTPSIDVMLDALSHCPEYHWAVLLQPTSPLRLARDIDGAVERCIQLNAPSCVSVCEVRKSPHWMFYQKRSRLYPVIERPLASRRQDLPKVYALNGAVYVAKTSWLSKNRTFIGAETVAYEMPEDRSIDIDTELDLKLIEAI